MADSPNKVNEVEDNLGIKDVRGRTVWGQQFKQLNDVPTPTSADLGKVVAVTPVSHPDYNKNFKYTLLDVNELSERLMDLGDYELGLTLGNYNQIFRKDEELYRLAPNIEVPYVTTGDWEQEKDKFQIIGAETLKQELADPNNGAGVIGYSPMFPNSPATTVGDILHTRYITSAEVGLHDTGLTPSERAQKTQDFWDYCASNQITCVMSPTGDNWFEVAPFTGAVAYPSILTIPSEINLYFSPGFKLSREDFDENAQMSQSRILRLGAETTNVTLSGEIEIDGKGDTVSWYNEHNHCMFIYGAKNVNAKNLSVIAYNAMGDCLSFSGSAASEASLTDNVHIGMVRLGKARRKSLVIESTRNCSIDTVLADNSEYDLNCLDYEPLGVTPDRPIDFHIEKCYLKSGTDWTAGSSGERRISAKLSFGLLNIDLQPDSTTRPIQSYAEDVSIGMLRIDARNYSANPFETLIHVQYGINFIVQDTQIIIPDNFDVSVLTLSKQTNRIPQVYFGKLSFLSEGNSQANFRVHSGLHVDKLEFYSISGLIDASIDGPSGGYFNGADININSVYARNVAKFEIACAVYQTANNLLGAHIRIGHISIDNSDSESLVTLSSGLLRARTSNSQIAITVGGLTLSNTVLPELYSVQPGGVKFHRITGAPGSVSHYYAEQGPEGAVPAKIGSTCVKNTGEFYLKVEDDLQTTGWKKLLTADSP